MSQPGTYRLGLLVGKDPNNPLFVRREKATGGLAGSFATYKRTMQAQVKQNGSFLLIEIKDRYTGITVPHVLEGIEEAARTSSTTSTGMRLPIKFCAHAGKVDLVGKRYLL